MSIQQAPQLAQATSQGGSSRVDVRHSSYQALGLGRHLVSILTRERETLAAHQAAQFSSGVTSHSFPFALARYGRQLARALSALLG
jgi:hypothetical protein